MSAPSEDKLSAIVRYMTLLFNDLHDMDEIDRARVFESVGNTLENAGSGSMAVVARAAADACLHRQKVN